MFIGEYTHTIDNKGRLAIPVKFRQALISGTVVTRGLDECLFLYPKVEWEKLADKLSHLPVSQAKARAFNRLMLAGAFEARLDSQGRIVIPEFLRTYARLKKKIIIAGLYNRLEIWDEDTWKRYKEETEKRSGDIAEQLKELDI